MRFEIERDAVLPVLSAALRVVPSRPPLPSLGCFRFFPSDEGLCLEAQSAVSGARCFLDAEVGYSDGESVLLPARDLVDLLRRLEPGKLSFESGDSSLKVVSGSNVYEFPLRDPGDFPDFPEVRPAASVSCDASSLGNLFRRTVFSAAFSSPGVLSGVKLELSGLRLLASAVDGSRLAVAWEPCMPEATGASAAALVPAAAAQELSSLLAIFSPGSVEVGFGEGKASFSWEGCSFYCSLLLGEFPDVRRLIPQACAASAVAPAEALRGACGITMLFSRSSRAAKVSIGEGGAVFEPLYPDAGRCVHRVSAAVSGEAALLCLDAQKLLEGLRAVDSGDAFLGFSAGGPAVVLPVPPGGGLLVPDPWSCDSPSGSLYVLMPLKAP